MLGLESGEEGGHVGAEPGTRPAGEVGDGTWGWRREEWEGRLARLREPRTESQDRVPGPGQLPDALSPWPGPEAHPPIAFPAGLSGSEALERLLLIPGSLLRR